MAKSKKMYTLEKGLLTPDKTLYQEFKEDRTKRYTSFFVTCYELDGIKQFLQNTALETWAYVCHDKDLLPDGTPKEIHFHLMFRCSQSSRIRITAFKKCFEQNVIVERIRNATLAFEYLTHKNDPDKHQYSTSDVRSFTEAGKREFFVSKDEYNELCNQSFINDLETCSMREMALKYGRDFMKNFSRYETFLATMKHDEAMLEMLRLEADFNDTTLFEQFGVDYTDYVKHTNNKLSAYLRKRILEYTALGRSVMRDEVICFTTEFYKLSIQERRIYIRQHASVDLLGIDELEGLGDDAI